ncbi:PQQ-binding-like beta-propeller repeat protein [Natrialbaceae archaeon A-CW3]
MVKQTRRQWLATCVGTGTAALAGCSSESDDTTTEPDDQGDTSSTALSDDGGSIGEAGSDELSSDVWPMAGVDLENTGYHPTATGPTGPVSERWVFETDGRIRGGAAIADQTVYIGSWDSNFYAIDLNDGDQLWSSYRAGSYYSGTPVIRNDKLFANAGGAIVALERDTGDIEWDTLQYDFSPVGSPTIFSGSLYTNSDDGDLISIDIGEGEVLSKHNIEGRGTMTTAISEGVLYAVGVPHFVYTVDLDTNERLWETEMKGSTTGLAIGENYIYAGVQGSESILALDPINGDIAWEVPVDSMVYSSISYHSGTLFAGTESGVVCIDTMEESIQWQVPYGGYRGNISLMDDILFSGSQSGIHALHRNDGEEKWNHKIGYVPGEISFSDDVLVAGTREGTVYALE